MTNDNIIREIDEELRSDRMRALWRRFGPYVIGAAVAVVLLVAVNEGWSWWQNSNSARSSDQFYAALKLADGTDAVAAQKALDEVIAQGSGSYPTLAKFREAALLAKDGKTADAVAAYDALANSEKNQHLRDLALVLAGFLLVDSGDVGQVEQRVQGLVATNAPLRNAAREALGLTKYKSGDLDGARADLEAVLNDPMASQETRGRLQVYVQQLIAEGAKAPAAEAAAPAVAPAADAAPAAAPAMEAAPAMAPAPAADAAPAAPAGDAAPAAPAAPAAN
jgi:hypothetical protein